MNQLEQNPHQFTGKMRLGIELGNFGRRTADVNDCIHNHMGLVRAPIGVG